MADEHAAPAEAYRAYLQAFDSLRPAAIAPFYHEPALLVSPPGVFVLATQQDVVRLFADFMGDLRARGHRRSDVSGLQAKLLSGTTALVSAQCLRTGADGELLQHFGQTCTLRQSKGKWLIAVNAIHEPHAALIF